MNFLPFSVCVMTLSLALSPAVWAAPAKPAAKPAPVASKSSTPTEAAAIAGAKALFEKYVALERAFNPAQGDLYAPNAQILALGSEGQKVSFDGGMMKEMLKTSMPLAKAQNDTVEYTNVSYIPDGNFVTIKCTRHSNLKNRDNPHRIVVASRDGKNWYIVQEIATAAR